MDKVTFDKLITSPIEINAQEASQLEELMSSFPYCQVAYLLMAKESHDKKSMLYPQKLKKASTYSLDRKVLHRVIHRRPSTPKSISQEKKIVIEEEQKKETSPETQKKTLFESAKPLATSDNSQLLKELAENIRLLKEKRPLYLQEKKAIPAVLINKEVQVSPPTMPKTALGDVPVPPRPSGLPQIIIADTKLGAELNPDLISQNSELEMLLSYLKPQSFLLRDQLTTIDKFIATDPKITRQTKLPIENNTPDLSKPSTELKIELTTENFAQILVKQNKIEKAKEVYRKLILKYPDKSAYFAAKLHELESR